VTTVSSTRRLLALWFPRFPADALKRRCRAWPDGPVVLVTKVAGALRVSATDRRATKLGLVPGLPLADARARIPGLHVFHADEAADAALLERLADWCERFTPLVALDAPHGLMLDVTGASHLFGGEAAMIMLAVNALARMGLEARGAIAGTSAAARALARFAPGTIVPPGAEAATLEPLDVEALGLDAEATAVLRRAGLKTAGQVARRTRAELTARFGAAMVASLDHALGRIARPIAPRLPSPDFMAEQRFAEPITNLDAALETLKSLAVSLGELLSRHGEGARALEAVFFRADGALRRIEVETGAPVRDPAIVTRLFRERMDALADPLDPGFGFDIIRLCARATERFDEVAASFDSSANAEQEVADLTDRLAARFGADRIVVFQAQDTHIPENFARSLPAQTRRPAIVDWARRREAGEAPRRPLRLFEKPQPIDVVAEIPEGPPLRFRWRGVLHATRQAEGPERIAMEWWRTETARPTRDYFRLEDEEGRRFWIYRDGLYGRETQSPRWYLHGLFA
jgi:protein ImuB